MLVVPSALLDGLLCALKTGDVLVKHPLVIIIITIIIIHGFHNEECMFNDSDNTFVAASSNLVATGRHRGSKWWLVALMRIMAQDVTSSSNGSGSTCPAAKIERGGRVGPGG